MVTSRNIDQSTCIPDDVQTTPQNPAQRLPSIRFRLALLVMSCVLPAAVVSAFLIYDHYRVERTGMLTEAMGTARSMVSVVDRDFDTVITALRALSVSDDIEPSRLAEFQRQADNVHAILPITGITLYDPRTRRELMSTAASHGELRFEAANAALLDQVQGDGLPAISGLYRTAAGAAAITVAVPVLREGVARYVLAGQVQPSALGAILFDQKMPDTWRGGILDADGRVVARTHMIERLQGKPVPAHIMQRVVAKPEDMFESETMDKIEVMTLYSRSQKSGWTVILGIPTEQLTAGLLRTLQSLIIATVVLLAMGLGMAWLVGGRIAHSMQALIAPATALGKGEAVQTPQVDFLEAEQVGASLLRASQTLADARERAGREILERRAAQEALQTADRRKDEFLATLAHELRNPMAPLVNSLEILRMSAKDKALPANVLDVMDRQLRQMVRLVDDLLDVSRITTDKLSIRKEPLILQDVVRHSIETSTPLVQQRRHALSVQMPDAPVPLAGDGTRLAQVFSNLLNNAAKYTQTGGRIGLAATVKDGQARIEISDNGIGIAADALPHVFDIFFQADQSLGRSQAGLGIGLSLARRLVELHGGALSASSAGPGQGSTFTVELPVAEEEGGTVLPAQHSGAPLRPLRVLVADDNVDHANTLRTLLQARGQTIQVCYDGLSALHAAESFDPQLAFLDIGMPRMDGYELAHRLRSTGRHGRCLLVAVTGWGQDRDQQRSKAAGFDRHIVKPLQAAQLDALLRERAAMEEHSNPLAHQGFA
ncbi:hybrid sensor histidine kinase/response regulator [Massilia endophytica]|uniref:hybrid sensor histidine kinase/response regulator n=1 Tax=Massilia endophytica TaxID=2899220 RepID=UPI001E2A82E2|nr:ATP-binding protein [Massilia endophytica]UGQ47434.1 ATP-binding protein [Massilia endophytica]